MVRPASISVASRSECLDPGVESGVLNVSSPSCAGRGLHDLCRSTLKFLRISRKDGIFSAEVVCVLRELYESEL